MQYTKPYRLSLREIVEIPVWRAGDAVKPTEFTPNLFHHSRSIHSLFIQHINFQLAHTEEKDSTLLLALTQLDSLSVHDMDNLSPLNLQIPLIPSEINDFRLTNLVLILQHFSHAFIESLRLSIHTSWKSYNPSSASSHPSIRNIWLISS